MTLQKQIEGALPCALTYRCSIGHIAACPAFYRPVVAELVERVRGEAEGWRTIESAPKDGTRVLLYTPDALAIEAIFTATYDMGAWWESRDLDEPNVNCPPTHWMPLPTPPSSDAPDRGSNQA